MIRKILLTSPRVLRHKLLSFQTSQGSPKSMKKVMTHRLWFINYDSEIHFELFVQFAETGSCDSYDQYSNDRNNCNINQLPPKPEIINNYQGMTHVLWLINPIFSSLENGLWELHTRGQLPEYWWVIPPRSDLHAEQKYMLALSKQR